MLWSPFSCAREARERKRDHNMGAEERERGAPMLWSPFSFAPKAARASRAQEKGDHNMGAERGDRPINFEPSRAHSYTGLGTL